MLISLVCGAFSLFNAVALVICGCSLPQELLSVHISILRDRNLCLPLLGRSVLACCELFHAEIGPFDVHNGLSRRSPDVPDWSLPDYFQSNLISSSSFLQVFKMKAVQLAEKLLPAFNTPTGIPWAIVNLKRSVDPPFNRS